MMPDYLHSIAIILYLMGITGVAGCAIGSMFIESGLWKQLREAPYRAGALTPVLDKLPVIAYSGSMLMLITGVLLIKSDYSALGHTWFTIKLILYVIMNVNIFFVGRPVTKRLLLLIPGLFDPDPTSNSALSKLRSRLKWYHISEFSILIFIYVLSVYQLRG
jgi:hypothetical protein